MIIFNGTYTITSPSGEHRTYRISTQGKDANFAQGQRIVWMLNGPDNEQDYVGFGFVTDTGIKVWRKKLGDGVTASFWERSARMIWSLATLGDDSPYFAKGCKLLLEKKCRICNRKLTNPDSIDSGIGPECAKREK